MMTVHDEARQQLVGGKLLPEYVWVAGQELRATVAEMSGKSRARVHRIANLLRRGSRMADRDSDTRFDEMFNQPKRTGNFRGKSDKNNATRSGILPVLEVFEGRFDNMPAWMRPARAILGRNVRPLHMYPGDRRIRKIHQGAGAARKSLERRRDESGKKSRDTGRSESINRMFQLFRLATWTVEIYSGKAIDLKIEETWKVDVHL